MQSKLSSFFPVTKKSSLPVLLYDANTGVTTFYKDYKDDEKESVFITTKCGIKLCMIENKESKKVAGIKEVKNENLTPLLKSNLQKCIRRNLVDNAIYTATYLFLNDPDELYRRLPIIYIEDVTLLQPFSTVVWWMMAGKDYLPYRRECDLVHLASFVKEMCECSSYFPYEKEEDVKELGDLDFTLSTLPLCIHLRVMYGGTAGDMKMMSSAYAYYSSYNEKGTNENKYVNEYNYADLVEKSKKLDYILEESIDFHPFPDILWKIREMVVKEDDIYLSTDDIKMAIWYIESAPNWRKESTRERSEEYRQSFEWKMIGEKMGRVRGSIREKYKILL